MALPFSSANRVTRAPPIDRPPANTCSHRAASASYARSISAYQSVQRVAFISCQLVPCPGSRGSRTVQPAAARCSAHGRKPCGEPVKPWLSRTPIDPPSAAERLGTGQHGHGVPRFTGSSTGLVDRPVNCPSSEPTRVGWWTRSSVAHYCAFSCLAPVRPLRLGRSGDMRRSSERRWPVLYGFLKYCRRRPAPARDMAPVGGGAWITCRVRAPQFSPATTCRFATRSSCRVMVPRRVTFLAKSEYFTTPGLKGRLSRGFFRGVGQVPVDREDSDAAKAALDTGVRILRRGPPAGHLSRGNPIPGRPALPGQDRRRSDGVGSAACRSFPAR